MTLTRAKLSWLPLIVAVCFAGSGCGSVNKLVGGKKGDKTSQPTPTAKSQLLTTFTVKADPQTGELTFQKSDAASASAAGVVKKQATPDTTEWGLSFTGRATYDNTAHILSGDVALHLDSSTSLQNV